MMIFFIWTMRTPTTEDIAVVIIDKGIIAPWPAEYAPWTQTALAIRQESLILGHSVNSPWGHPFFVTDACPSTMDLAFHLQKLDLFPPWSSVLAGHQHEGRGQFHRPWISCPGNLYASMRLPNHRPGSPLTPLKLALAVQTVFQDLGLFSQFKWPNDFLVSGKKVGGILVEERDDIVIAGVGINLAAAPATMDLNEAPALPPGCLEEFGLGLTPVDLWPLMMVTLITFLSHAPETHHDNLLNNLEHRMAFMGETVEFMPHHGKGFTAVVAGLSPTGGLRLKTPSGETTWHSGCLFPKHECFSEEP